MKHLKFNEIFHIQVNGSLMDMIVTSQAQASKKMGTLREAAEMESLALYREFETIYWEK